MASDSKTHPPTGGKRAFTTPTLRIYGTVGEITGAIDGVSMPDGAGHPKNNMTRPGMNKP
jgi:hypothetical protein